MNCIHDMSSRSVMWLHTLKKIPGLWNVFKDCTRFLIKRNLNWSYCLITQVLISTLRKQQKEEIFQSCIT
jgi:hypothetical protein